MQNQDQNSTGLNVLSFLFPLIGLILYLVYQKEQPVKAAGIGKWALIGFVVNVIILLVL